MTQHNVANIIRFPGDSLADVPARVISVMEVDRAAIAHNYQFIQSQLPHAKCSAVVKADAYGVGILNVSPVLYSAGCRDFFVATLEEGISLRKNLPDSNIYSLGGLLSGMEADFHHHNLIPVLNDIGQIDRWNTYARQVQHKLPTTIFLDTGMWRLGLPPREILQLANTPQILNAIDLKYFISHLACSDSPHHDKNLHQLNAFTQALELLPQAKASFANSHAIFLGNEYHFDLVRPGRSLYGLGTKFLHTGGIRPVVQIFARIIQVRDIGKGETVGYDAMYCTAKDTKIATIAVGYADGLSRALSNHGRVYIKGYEAPMIGRISMDLITIDVGGVPDALVTPGAWVEIMGEHSSPDDVALAAGTTSREIVSKLGTRFHRIYK